MKLSRSYHCKSCDEVFEQAKNGECPACGSQDIFALGWLLKTPEERRAWLDRIGATK